MNSNGLDCILQAPAPFSALHTKHSTQNANILEFSSSAFVDRKQQYSLCDHGRNRFCMAQKYPKCSETHPKLSKQKECCVLDRNETSHKNSREIAFTNRLQKLEPHSRKLFHNEHHQYNSSCDSSGKPQMFTFTQKAHTSTHTHAQHVTTFDDGYHFIFQCNVSKLPQRTFSQKNSNRNKSKSEREINENDNSNDENRIHSNS